MSANRLGRVLALPGHLRSTALIELAAPASAPRRRLFGPSVGCAVTAPGVRCDPQQGLSAASL